MPAPEQSSGHSGSAASVRGDAEIGRGQERTGAVDPGPGKAHWDRTGPTGAGECDVSVLLEPPQDDACAGCLSCGNKNMRLCHA